MAKYLKQKLLNKFLGECADLHIQGCTWSDIQKFRHRDGKKTQLTCTLLHLTPSCLRECKFWATISGDCTFWNKSTVKQSSNVLRGWVNVTSLTYFRWTEMDTIFILCFNICLTHGYKIAHLSSHSSITYWMSNMASDAKACFSSKVEYRAVIRYLYLKGKTGKEIHGELADVYGSSAPSYAQVKFWVGEFKRGRTSLED